jgi:UDP-N-acetylglucosamine transferase subunit ALG13
MKGTEGEGILMVVEVGTMMVVVQVGTGAMAAAAVGGETVGGEIRNPRISTTIRIDTIDIISEVGGGSSNQLFSKNDPIKILGRIKRNI